MKEYPESVLTKDRKGNLEVRNLSARGQFVMYDYRDAKNFKQVENNKACNASNGCKCLHI